MTGSALMQEDSPCTKRCLEDSTRLRYLSRMCLATSLLIFGVAQTWPDLFCVAGCESSSWVSLVGLLITFSDSLEGRYSVFWCSNYLMGFVVRTLNRTCVQLNVAFGSRFRILLNRTQSPVQRSRNSVLNRTEPNFGNPKYE